VLPDVQRSWIGKAHFVGKSIKPSYFRPGTILTDDGTFHNRPLPPHAEEEEWVLVDGTPATCTQLGLFHFFQDRGPVDVVVSGPNYGRNSTTLFSLSSGTIGGAMEAAVFRKKAIALSYAFNSRDHDAEIIKAASSRSADLVEYLVANWGPDVELYSINVPLIKGLQDKKILHTWALENYWTSGSSFEEVDADEVDESADVREQEIRSKGEEFGSGDGPESTKTLHARHKHRHFKWSPNFADVNNSVEKSEPGNDGWAINGGYTSVTSLRASFQPAKSHEFGELKM